MSSETMSRLGTVDSKNPLSVSLQRIFDTFEIRRNIVTGVTEFRAVGTVDTFEPVNEADFYLWLRTAGYKISLTDVTAFLSSGLIPTYDPFLMYFESLPKPDGDPYEIISTFAGHVKTTDPDDWSLQFCKWLIRAVRCALEPDAMNKQCLLLQSTAQNLGKTTFLRYLIPPRLRAYYSEILTPDKDGLQTLIENMIINLDELTGLSRFELNQLKAQFSRTTVSVRKPYARKAETNPRRCSFVGSTNSAEFLTDETGSVRWLVFTVTGIDFSYTHTPIDAVWSAAYFLYKNGYTGEMTADELTRNGQRNEGYTMETAEMDYIGRHFTKPAESCCHQSESCCHLTTTEIMDFINERHPTAHLKSVDRIGKAMQKLGFQRVAKREGATVRRGYLVDIIGNVATVATVATKSLNLLF